MEANFFLVTIARAEDAAAEREAWIARVIAQAGIVNGPLYSISTHHRGEESPPIRLHRQTTAAARGGKK